MYRFHSSSFRSVSICGSFPPEREKAPVSQPAAGAEAPLPGTDTGRESCASWFRCVTPDQMPGRQRSGRRRVRFRGIFLFTALLLLSLTTTGCGDTSSPEPQPTFALDVSPGTEVEAGKSVAIVAEVEPLEHLELEWSISGTAGGKLNTNTGEQVVYTAGLAAER